jgi:type IV secretion system protein VirB10
MDEEKENIPQVYDPEAEFGNEEYNDTQPQNQDTDTSEAEESIQKQHSAVAGSPKSQKIAIILVLLISGILMYFVSRPEKKTPSSADKYKTVEVKGSQKPFDKRPVDEDGKEIVFGTANEKAGDIEPFIESIIPETMEGSDISDITIPELPQLEDIDLGSDEDFDITPKFKTKKPPKQDTTTTTATTKQIIEPKREIEIDEELEDDLIAKHIFGQQQTNKRPSNMMILNSNTDIGAFEEKNDKLKKSNASSTTATKIQNPKRLIAEGKIIDSVLETAINSDLEGKVRAIITRDVYSDFSNQILIPRGSRLIGSYTSSIVPGQSRILVQWSRLIRPDAVDISINSPSTDQFGRSGIGGNVDRKYFELINSTILVSLITMSAAIAAEDFTGSSGTTTQSNTDGSSSTSGGASDVAALEIIKGITSTGKTVLNNLINISPTITVPHGTRIKVFVNQDLVFPETDSDQGIHMIN